MDKFNYDIVLFDLDGTLTDSIDGIVNAVKYSCRNLGLRIPDAQELLEFIGPPMTESFSTHFGLKGEENKKAMELYHVYYADKGWKENKVYDGITEMLENLKKKGKTLALCTNKPAHYAKDIMDYFDLTKYMDYIGGRNDEQGITSKWKVIDHTLKMLNAEDINKAIMVGDRHFDVEGADIVGIKTIGVTFGYGTRKELEESGAVVVVDTPKELADLF